MLSSHLTYAEWDFCADPVMSLPAISIEQTLSAYLSSNLSPTEISTDTFEEALDFINKSIAGEEIINKSSKNLKFVIDFSAIDSYRHTLKAFDYNEELHKLPINEVLHTSRDVINKLLEFSAGKQITLKTDDIQITKNFFYSLSSMPVLNK